MKFKIPYPPTKAGKSQWAKEYGLNAYWAGKHWAKRKADAEYWHCLVHAELRKQGIKPRIAKNPVSITFRWNDRLDLSNHAAMSKMIEDAVKGWIIQDDSRKWVQEIRHIWHDENYIEVEIKERKMKNEN